MSRRLCRLLAASIVCAAGALPLWPAHAAPRPAAPALPQVVSTPDGSAFLEGAAAGRAAWRFSFFNAALGAAIMTPTVRADSYAVVRVHHNFAATLYAGASPLGAMPGFMGLDATLTPHGFVGRVKVSVAMPGGDNADLLISHYVLTTPMSAGNTRQAQLVATAVETTMFTQHWPVLYDWSGRAVRAASTEAAFATRMAPIFAAQAGTVQVLRAGTAGQLHRLGGVLYYDDAVTIGYEARARINGTLSKRGVTRGCRVRLAWDTGAWRYAALPCKPAVETAWFPLEAPVVKKLSYNTRSANINPFSTRY